MNRSHVLHCYCLIVEDMVTNSVSPERDSIALSLDARFLVSIKPLYLDQCTIKDQCMLACLCWSAFLSFRLNPTIARQLAHGKPRLNLVAVLKTAKVHCTELCSSNTCTFVAAPKIEDGVKMSSRLHFHRE